MNSDWPIYPKFNNDWRWRWKEISVPSTADSEYLAELVKAVEGTGKFKKLIVTTFQFPRAYKMTPTDEQILTNFRKKIAQVIADLWYLEAGRSLVKAVVENYSVAIVPRLTLTFSVHSTAHGSDPRNDNAVIPDRFSEPELAAGEPTARTGVGGGRLEFEVWKAVSLARRSFAPTPARTCPSRASRAARRAPSAARTSSRFQSRSMSPGAPSWTMCACGRTASPAPNREPSRV
jgi:hypothetical protein